MRGSEGGGAGGREGGRVGRGGMEGRACMCVGDNLHFNHRSAVINLFQKFKVVDSTGRGAQSALGKRHTCQHTSSLKRGQTHTHRTGLLEALALCSVWWREREGLMGRREGGERPLPSSPSY